MPRISRPSSSTSCVIGPGPRRAGARRVAGRRAGGRDEVLRRAVDERAVDERVVERRVVVDGRRPDVRGRGEVVVATPGA